MGRVVALGEAAGDPGGRTICPGSRPRTCSTCSSARPEPTVTAGDTGDSDEIFYDDRQRGPSPGHRGPQGGRHARSNSCGRSRSIPHRAKKDPREIKILDPACGSGHFLLYCFALLLVIYEEAYDDPDLGPALQADYPTKDDLRKAVPGLILRHNLHGIDIDLRCTQIAALALWLRCQRAYQEMGLKKDRPRITKSNIVCAEPMPGEEGLLDEFLKTLREDRLEALIRQVMNVPEDQRVRATRAMADSLCDLVRTVWDKMRLAGEAGSLLKIEEELQDAIRQGQEQWEERLRSSATPNTGCPRSRRSGWCGSCRAMSRGSGSRSGTRPRPWSRRHSTSSSRFASNGGRLQRQLFAEDAVQGFGFVDVCRQRFDVVLMNPPFGDASKPTKSIHRASLPPDQERPLCRFRRVRGLDVLRTRGCLGRSPRGLGSSCPRSRSGGGSPLERGTPDSLRRPRLRGARHGDGRDGGLLLLEVDRNSSR